MKIILLNTSFLTVVVFSSFAVIPPPSVRGAAETSSPSISYDSKDRYFFTTVSESTTAVDDDEDDDGSMKIMASLIRTSVVLDGADGGGGENGTCEERTDRPEPFGVAESVFLALTLGLLIMVMIVGNILVITAIVLERELQRAQYYLVLSLAVADLTVGVVVSPLAALYDINRQWHLGVPMCDFWIVSDVLACTSSILHLLAIALDRYWSITDVSYIQKRTPRRIGIMILFVWIVSLCVSVAPILGWKDTQFTCRVEVRNECLISQAIGYQIFSTTTAFYGPLVLICILYWKIYKAAKRRIQMQVKRRSNTVAQLRAKILALQQASQDGSDRRRSTFRKRKTGEKPSGGGGSTSAVGPQSRTPSKGGGGGSNSNSQKKNNGRAQVQIRVIQPSSNEPTAVGLEIDSLHHHHHNNHALRNGHLNVYQAVVANCSAASSCYSLNEECSSGGEEASTASGAFAVDYSTTPVCLPSYQADGVPTASSTGIAGKRNGVQSLLISGGSLGGGAGTEEDDTDSPLGDGLESPTPSPLIVREKKDSLTVSRVRALSLNSPTCTAALATKGARTSRHSTFSQSELTSTSLSSAAAVAAQKASEAAAVAAAAAAAKRKRPRTKKETIEASRERRAGRTLAIITGIFVVCWVPFFVLALIRPICGGPHNCPVPEPLDSVFLWLGYVNSAVNPIIYTIFSPDFRMAFKRTLERFCLLKRHH